MIKIENLSPSGFGSMCPNQGKQMVIYYTLKLMEFIN
jgi:hypothetical protein